MSDPRIERPLLSLLRGHHWRTVLVLALACYWPYAEALHGLWPLRLFGFSVLVTVLPTSAILLSFLARAPFERWRTLVVIVLTGIVVLLGRSAFRLDDEAVGFLNRVAVLRFLLLVPMMNWLAETAAADGRFRRLAPKIIAVNAAIASAVAVTYSLQMHHFRVAPGADDLYLVDLQTRAAGLMAGTNVFANFSVVGMMALASAGSAWLLVLSPVLIMGVVAASSRLALICAIAVLANATIASRRVKFRLLRVLAGLAIGALVVTASAWTGGGDPVVARFGDAFATDTEARLDKYRIGAAAWATSPETVLFGARTSTLVVGMGVGDSFSDNSLLTALTSVGAVATLIFCYQLFSALGPLVARRQHLHVLVMLATLLFNNAILWDVWMFLVLVMCHVSARDQSAVGVSRIRAAVNSGHYRRRVEATV